MKPATPVTVTVALQTDKTAADYARLAQAVEGVGLQGISLFADLGFQPPGPALAIIAEHTSRVRIGVACYNPQLTHPVHIAAEAAALQHLSGGRGYVGVARGAWLDRVGVTDDGGLKRFNEALAVLRMVLAGNDSGYAGAYFRIDPGFRLSNPTDSMPMLVGTWGAQTAAIAVARGASEIKVGGSAAPESVTKLRAATADRVAIVLGAVTVCDHDRQAARRLARREVALYLDVVAGFDPDLAIEPEALGAVRSALGHGDLDAAAAAVPDEALARYAFAGTPADIADQAATLVTAGVSRIEFGTPHGLDAVTGIELLGREVAPAIGEAGA
ncbi:MAG: LLM class flavin-dependent oxidoreductase [Actinomycetota bacterium]|nr:LLM class flavin-dependent oxidoreductase [Actinomycetota bacterium]